MNQDVLAGSQPTVSLGAVLEGVAERLQGRFTALVHDLPAQTAESRASHLLQFLHDARQQLLRAAAVVHDTRKLPPLTQLVQPGGVLDIAAHHARALQSTADELFRANGLLTVQRVPLFNVPDALDVLSTGTYRNLPASIQDQRGPRPAQEPEQRRLLNQLNHLLYAHLLKAHLPESLRLVEVTGGYAVLSCAGLYEVQLSLFQQPYPPQVDEARQSAAEAAAPAAQQGEQQQKQQQQQQAPAEAAAGDADEPTKPQVRWQWTLTSAVLLPNAAKQQPLRPVQMEQLLRTVRERMYLAADAAAIKAAARDGAAAAGQPGPDAVQPHGPDGKAPQPSASGAVSGRSGPVAARSGPAASTISGMSGLADPEGDGGGSDPHRGLQLSKYAADETTLPLRVMHAVLRDVAAQMLLQEVRRSAQQLVAPGSKWEGHLKLARAEQLTPGIRVLYWQQAPALLPMTSLSDQQAGAAAPAVAAAAAAGGPAGSKGVAGAFPAIEVGLGSDGTVQQQHMPALQLPGTQQDVQLVLNTHTVDVVGLLLQAIRAVVGNQLQFLHGCMLQQLEQQGASDSLQLRLCTCDHLNRFAEQQGQQQQRLPDTLEVVLDGRPAVAVSFQCWSGRVVLRPGSAYGGDTNIEYGSTLRQHQEALRSKQSRLLKHLQQQQQQPQQQQQQRMPAGNAISEQQQLQQQQHIAAACMRELANGLTELFTDMLLKTRYSNFVTAARMLSLQVCQHLRHNLAVRQQQQLLQSPQAAAARMTASRGIAGAGAGAVHLHLAMPSMQLPPYMLLLAAGSWCGALQAPAAGQVGAPSGAQQPGQAAAGSTRLVPAQVSVLLPALEITFARRPGLHSSDGLVLVLCNAEGLPGPVVKEMRLPAGLKSSSSSRKKAAHQVLAAAAAAAAVSRGSVAPSAVQRKRRRTEDDAGQQEEHVGERGVVPAGQGEAAGAPSGPAQQQELHPQQQQLGEYMAQLSAAVEFSEAQLTYERLVLELNALQVVFEEQQPLPRVQEQQQAANGLGQQQHPPCVQGQQQPGGWPQPSIRLISIPGCPLFQQLQRPAGCSPDVVGLSAVWLCCGPSCGQWSVHLTGKLYSQQCQQPAPAAAAAVGAAPALTASRQQEEQQHQAAAALWCWQYDFWAGDDVRGAVLQLQQLVHMQSFLHRLELLALGSQQLDVADSSSCLAGSSPAAATAGNKHAAPAAADVCEEGGDGDAEQRPIKRARHNLQDNEQQQHLPDGWPDGLEAPASNGPMAAPLMNGMVQPAAASNHTQQHPDATNDTAQEQPTANGVHTAGSKAADDSWSAPQRSSSSCGLLWDWPGTGLVRLASYSCSQAVLESGRPLQQVSSSKPQQQQQQGMRSKVQFLVSWQPLYDFKPRGQQTPVVQPSVGPWGEASSAWPSSSSSTIWVDVHDRQHQQQTAGPGPASSSSKGSVPSVLLPEDVLAAVCCVSCSSPCVPDMLLSELAAMADDGNEDVLLDALAVLGWPLSQLQPLLGHNTPSKVGLLLSKGPKVTGKWRPSITSSMPSGNWWHLRVTVAAELVGPEPEAQQQAAEPPNGAAPAVKLRRKQQLLLDFVLVTGGAVKVYVQQLAPAAATGGSAGRDLLHAGSTASSIKQEVDAAAAAATAAAPVTAVYAQGITHAVLQHIKRKQPGVNCLPAFGPCTWQQQVVPQYQGPPPDSSSTNTAVRQPLSGCWVQTGDLHALLPCFIDAWTQHTVKIAVAEQERAAQAAAARVAAAAAAAATATAAAAVGGTPPPAGAQQQPAAVQQQQQQQQQAGQVAPQQHPVGQQQPSQQQPQQQQGQQQQQQHVPQMTQQGQQVSQVMQQHNQQQQQQQLAQQQLQMSQQAAMMLQRAQQVSGNAAYTATVPGMAASMPMAGAAAAVVRPGTLTVPMHGQAGLVAQAVPGAARVSQPMMGHHAAPGMMPSTGWTMTMQSVPQQQHPAQQQHRQS